MVTTRSGITTNKEAEEPTIRQIQAKIKVKLVKKVKKAKKTSSKENEDNTASKIKNQIRDEFKKKHQISESPKSDHVRRDEDFKEISFREFHEKIVSPNVFSIQSPNIMEVTSQYDMTFTPELVDMEEKEYRKDKKIPSWAQQGDQLYLNLFLQQPYFIDLMSNSCFPDKSNTNLSRMFY